MLEMTQVAKEILKEAKDIASDFKSQDIASLHLFLALAKKPNSTVSNALKNQQFSYDQIMNRATIFKGDRHKNKKLEMTPKLKECIELAGQIARKDKSKTIGSHHLMIALLQEKDSMAIRLIDLMEINKNKLYLDILRAVGKDIKGQRLKLSIGEKNHDTPILNKFSTDYARLAKEGKFDVLVGRNEELDRIIQILARKTKNNPCLVGEPGVGKTAIIEGLATRVLRGEVPDFLRNKKIKGLNLPAIVAGTKYRGEFEERVKTIIDEVKKSDDIILFLDEMHTLIGAGAAEGTMDASGILKPALARGEIQLIGATTYEEYRKHIEKDSAFERRIQPVVVNEPSQDECIEILEGLKNSYEAYHNVIIGQDAILASVKLSKRYINDRYLPDKAIDVLDEAASRVRLKDFNKDTNKDFLNRRIKELGELELQLELEDRKELNEIKRERKKLIKKLDKKDHINNLALVDEASIKAIVADWTKIPIESIAENESKKLLDLEKKLHKRVIGQNEAINSVADAIRRGRIGLSNPDRPIGSFLFLGPTGVGKTELCKALAQTVFGNEDMLIRLDMSEYMEKHSVSKLIGSPPGYVGYEEGGQLSERVKKKPYSVILFDEIEKAHPDVFNILLQVLDDGHITDSKGRKVYFKNTVIIMTSNLGAKNLANYKPIGFNKSSEVKIEYEDMKKRVMLDLKKAFRPEFINRIDEIIVFHSLTKAETRDIIKLLLSDLSNRLLEEYDIKVRYNNSLINYLEDVGFSPEYGARPLKRAIQTKIENLLARDLLNKRISSGDRISMGYRNKEIYINRL